MTQEPTITPLNQFRDIRGGRKEKSLHILPYSPVNNQSFWVALSTRIVVSFNFEKRFESRRIVLYILIQTEEFERRRYVRTPIFVEAQLRLCDSPFDSLFWKLFPRNETSSRPGFRKSNSEFMTASKQPETTKTVFWGISEKVFLSRTPKTCKLFLRANFRILQPFYATNSSGP